MSQQQIFGGIVNPPVTPNIEFLEGNDLVPVGPNPATYIVKIVGDNTQGIDVSGNAPGYTETITAFDSTELQKGVVLLASNAEAIAGTDIAKAITSDDLKAKLGTQTTNGLAYGAGTSSPISWLAEAADGEIPIGSTGNAPVLANITSPDGSIDIINGPGSIGIQINSQVSGTGQTIGAVDADVVTFDLGIVPGTYTLEGRVAGFNASTPAGAGFQMFATVRTDGISATLIGIPDIVGNSEAAVSSALADFVVSGNDAIVRVTGVSLLTIDWAADLDYTFRS